MYAVIGASKFCNIQAAKLKTVIINLTGQKKLFRENGFLDSSDESRDLYGYFTPSSFPVLTLTVRETCWIEEL